MLTMQKLTKADTVALWHAVEALRYQCFVMKSIVPPLSQESQDAEWARLTAARSALRKVNAIRASGVAACHARQGWCSTPVACADHGRCPHGVTACQPAQERAEFEAAMEGEELDFTLYTLPGCENSYSNTRTQLAYFAWRQGRAASGVAIPLEGRDA